MISFYNYKYKKFQSEYRLADIGMLRAAHRDQYFYINAILVSANICSLQSVMQFRNSAGVARELMLDRASVL